MRLWQALVLSILGVPPGLGAAGQEKPPEERAVLHWWLVDDSTKVLPGAKLGPPRSMTEDDGPVELSGAGGETVAFQLVLESPVTRERVRVRVGSADAKEGERTLGPDRFEIFLETYIDCPPVDPKVVSLGPGRYPDPLVPLWLDGPGSREVAHPLELPGGQRRVLWFDVEIPRGEPAGRYRGRIEIDLDGEQTVPIEIALRRHRFDLPVRPSLTAWAPLYPGRFNDRERSASLDTKAALELAWRYFRMAHDHRFVTQSIEAEPRATWDDATGALLAVDWSVYDLLHAPVLDGTLFPDREPPALWKVGGFVWWGVRAGDRPYFGATRRNDSITPAHRRALTEYSREIRRHFDERGWTKPELFMYMIDEPELSALPELGKFIAGYGDAIHEARADIRHLVTMEPSASGDVLGAVDIWATWGAGYRPGEMKKRQALGERAWFYQKHEPFVGGHGLNHEGLGLRSWAWIAWRHDVDGIFLWAANYWNRDPYRDPINWNADLLGNGVLFYPGAMLPSIGFPAIRGPVGSVRMKTLRRGLFDHDYFALLGSLGGDPDRYVARIVTSALNEAEYDPIWKHPLWGAHGAWSHDPAEWDAVRREIAAEIETRSEGR